VVQLFRAGLAAAIAAAVDARPVGDIHHQRIPGQALAALVSPISPGEAKLFGFARPELAAHQDEEQEREEDVQEREQSRRDLLLVPRARDHRTVGFAAPTSIR
jgi:hypothetical protein